MTHSSPQIRDVDGIDPPPILKTWPRLYGLVLLYLFSLIFGLWIVTRTLAY